MDKYVTQEQNEMFVLGMMLQDNTLLSETRLRKKHFLNGYHRRLFETMQELHNDDKPVDMVSLSQLPEQTVRSFGGIDTLSTIYGMALKGTSFNYCQQKMVEFIAVEEARREINEFIQKTDAAHSTKQIDELIGKVSSIQIDTLKPQPSFKDKLINLQGKHMNMPDSGISGTNTGYSTLNAVFDGWQSNDLIIIAARPSVGKTAFVLETMRRGAHADKNYMGTFFSCEMDPDSILNRWIATEGKIPVSLMRNPNKLFRGRDELWRSYSDALGNLAKLNIDVREEKHIHDIRAAIRKIVKENPDKKHLFAIDHLGHVKVDGNFDSNHIKFTYIMQELKDIQTEVGHPIILIAQLNRAVEGKADKAPSLSDIRESGSIEEIADVVIFPHRPAYFDREKRDVEEIHDVELIIAKNRNGFCGSIDFKFVKKTNLFLEVQR